MFTGIDRYLDRGFLLARIKYSNSGIFAGGGQQRSIRFPGDTADSVWVGQRVRGRSKGSSLILARNIPDLNEIV